MTRVWSQVALRKHHKASVCDGIPAISYPKSSCYESAVFNMSTNLENSAVTRMKRSVFIPIPKKGNAVHGIAKSQT